MSATTLIDLLQIDISQSINIIQKVKRLARIDKSV